MGLVRSEPKDSALVRQAGKRVASELRHIYHGDADAAAKDIEDICENPEFMEAWATRMLRGESLTGGGRMPNTGQHCDPFRWVEIPESMREAAIRGMAMAYLVQTSQVGEGE